MCNFEEETYKVMETIEEKELCISIFLVWLEILILWIV
jgi:hypothetical protein